MKLENSFLIIFEEHYCLEKTYLNPERMQFVYLKSEDMNLLRVKQQRTKTSLYYVDAYRTCFIQAIPASCNHSYRRKNKNKKKLSIWCFFEITDLGLWHPTTYEILRLMVWFPCMEIIHWSFFWKKWLRGTANAVLTWEDKRYSNPHFLCSDCEIATQKHILTTNQDFDLLQMLL